MNRRTLLASTTTAFVGIVTGCLDGSPLGGSDQDGWDPSTVGCHGESRPKPSEPETDEAVSPLEYPDLLDTTSDEELVAYVEAFEEAYVRNEYVRVHRDDLTFFRLFTGEASVVASGDEWAVVRLTYQYTDGLGSDEDEAVGSSDEFVAKYAITTQWVRRTVDEGRNADPPDPRESGTFVACFGE
ncbi:hypothetical protein [Halovivax gelatinilyticus]|uniref:hypothetical protein n=1 Tax=Halovivax gelatinilyticus TaxID=2961597 RepID=UPI0020CA4481|nr:hypothetical protein [Halovivax gelatinilyticus]